MLHGVWGRGIELVKPRARGGPPPKKRQNDVEGAVPRARAPWRPGAPRQPARSRRQSPCRASASVAPAVGPIFGHTTPSNVHNQREIFKHLIIYIKISVLRPHGTPRHGGGGVGGKKGGSNMMSKSLYFAGRHVDIHRVGARLLLFCYFVILKTGMGHNIGSQAPIGTQSACNTHVHQVEYIARWYGGGVRWAARWVARWDVSTDRHPNV